MKKIEAPLIEALIQINRFFQEHHVRYCLIGGIAAGFWGEPRYTRDMDFTVVSRSGLKGLVELLKKAGFSMQSKNSSQIQVTGLKKLKFQADLILVEMEYQDLIVQRAIPVNIFGVSVPICTAEDLIILKLIANRRQDLLDIENILKKNFASLDKEYLKTWFQFWALQELFQKEFKGFSIE